MKTGAFFPVPPYSHRMSDAIPIPYKLLTFQSYKVMPWKNGKGQTREIIKLPGKAPSATFGFRLSMASLGEPGPFSAFPGIERTIVALDGQGFTLTHGQKPDCWIPRLKAHSFSGDVATEMTSIRETTLDLNAMVDSRWGKSEVFVESSSKSMTLATASPCSLLFFTAIDHRAFLKPLESSGGAIEIPPLGTLLFQSAFPKSVALELEFGGSLIWGRVFPHYIRT